MGLCTQYEEIWRRAEERLKKELTEAEEEQMRLLREWLARTPAERAFRRHQIITRRRL